MPCRATTDCTQEADLFEEIGVESDAAVGYDGGRIEKFLVGGGGGRPGMAGSAGGLAKRQRV